MSKITNVAGLTLLTFIVGQRQEYESGAVAQLGTALNGGTVAIFGVPSRGQGGPVKGQQVDMAIVQTLDTEGNVSSRAYGGQWQPSANAVNLTDLPKAFVAPPAAREVYVKPADYQRKTATVLADELEPAKAPTLVAAGDAD